MNKTALACFAIAMIAYLPSCQDTYSQGKRIYTSLCANCHMEDGSGLNDLIPPLKGSKYLNENNNDIVCIIRNGVRADSLGLTLKYMPAHPKMTEVEMTNLLNYINTTFANGQTWTLQEVKTALKKCKK